MPKRPFVAAASLAFLCTFLVFGKAKQNPIAAPNLYLLTGTPTNEGEDTFSVELYELIGGKPKHVRTVASQQDGLFAIHAQGDAIFVLHPHIIPKSVSIVDIRDPERPDDVIFNPEGLLALDQAVTAAEPPGLGPVELIPLFTGTQSMPKGRNELRDPNKWNLVSVSSEATGTAPRVRSNAWNEYAALRVDGTSGGPSANLGGIFGTVLGNNLALDIVGHTSVVDALPPNLRGTKPFMMPVLAINEKYLLLEAFQTKDDFYHESDSVRVFIHDRDRNTWKTIQLSVLSITRLIGPWLCLEGSSGMRVLQNLDDNRKIQIETGAEDSEILDVNGTAVLYRSHDAIYEAQITNSSLQKPILLLQDAIVPDVHWIFWGP